MYRNILVPIDLDHPTGWGAAFAAASAMASCFSSRLTICTVLSDAVAIGEGEWHPISIEQRLFDLRARLEGVAASADLGRDCRVELASGTIAGGVVEIAERIGADLIILASHEPAARDYLLAARAIRVARRAPCSVLIVRQAKAQQ